jgi:hypothetical protein
MSYPTQAQISRAVKAARKLGIGVAGFRVGADGSIEVFDKGATPVDEYEQWRASKKPH